MSYQITARKWRPQTFDEVVYQEHISRTLKNSIKNGRISHAYLFSGPRGVGKTTMARILARSVNCAKGPAEIPCGACDNCSEIKAGNSFDVIEIDGASNRGIEDIRELRENVNFVPVKSRYKIYIIDEVHMLTAPAFNALLKTLEEPPAHVIFIFATTEYHQIPETILSRCQKYFFKKIPVESIVPHLRRIVDKDGYRISDRALYSIARSAEGSMRDAQSILDQVVSFGSGDGGEIDEDDALAILGIVPLESYLRILLAVGESDAPSAMEEIERISSLGADVPRYVTGLIGVFRALRLIRGGIAVRELLSLSQTEADELAGAARLFHDEELSLMFLRASDLEAHLRYSSHERTHLEMAVLDMIAIKAMPSIASIVRKIGGGAEPGPEAPAVPGTGSPGPSPSRPAPRSAAATTVPVTPGTARPAEPAPVAESSKETLGLQKAWQRFLGTVREEKQSLHLKLKVAEIEDRGDTAALVFSGGHDRSYYQKILPPRDLATVGEALSSLTGRKLRVDIDVKAAAPRTAPAGPAPTVEDDAPPPDAEMLKNPSSQEYDKVPGAVEKLVNTFHGEIIQKKKGDR